MFKNRVTKLTQNQFLRHNAVFFMGSMAVAFINYLYYPVLGRLMSTIQFGELQVIVSTYMQIAIVLSVLTMVTINIYVNQKDSKKAVATIGELEKASLYIGLAIFVIVCVLSTPIAHALKFNSPYPFIAMALAFVISIPQAFKMAYLRAHKEFKAASTVGFIGAVAKLVLSALLVLAMLYTFGAVLGIALSQVVALIVANRYAVKAGLARKETKAARRKPDLSLITPQLPYAFFVLFMTLLTTLQISIDVTLVKYYLPPETAGSYAAIATVARIIFFLTGSITAVMLSSIGQAKPVKENINNLLRSAGLNIAIGGAATLFFILFPTFTLHLLLGARYDGLAHYLPWLSIAIFIGSLVTILSSYHVALRSYTSIFTIFLGSLTSLLFVIMNTKTIEHIIQGLLLGSSVSLAGLIIYTIITSIHNIKGERVLHGGKAG